MQKFATFAPVSSFSAYPDMICQMDYCVDGFAEDADIISFVGEYFPRIEYISNSMITRHC